MSDLKQIRNKQPLAYLLPNINTISSLAYIDDEFPELKNNIEYLIRSQQQNMPLNEQEYLTGLEMAQTPFINSEAFGKKLRQIEMKMEKAGQKQKKDKKEVDSKFELPNPKLPSFRQQMDQIKKKHATAVLKEVNLQLYEKFGPGISKESLAALENRKKRIEGEILKQRRFIENINIRRKYDQMEAKEREQAIYDRTQVMLYKRRKVE